MDQELLIIIFSILALSQVTTLLYFWLFDRKVKGEIDRSLAGGSASEYQSRGLGLLRGAMKKSQEMLVSAELEGIKAVAHSKLATDTLEQRYSREVALTAEDLQKQFIKEVATLSEALKSHLAKLEDFSTAAQKTQLEQNKVQVEKLYLSFEKELRDTITKLNADSLQAVSDELTRAKEEIAAYKAKRLTEVEGEIVSLIGDVLKEVLRKEASISGQTEEILTAFAKAKSAHFL